MPDAEDVRAGRHDGRHRTVRRVWRTDPRTAYGLVSDVVAAAAHSQEVLDVVWDRRASLDQPSVGDRFTARNSVGAMQWTSTSTVVCAEPGRRFTFAVGAADRPTAVWSFDLFAVAVPGAGTATTVEYTVVLGSGPSMFDTVRHLPADHYDAIVDERLEGFSASMADTLDALGARAASQGDQVTPCRVERRLDLQ